MGEKLQLVMAEEARLRRVLNAMLRIFNYLKISGKELKDVY